MTPSWNSQAGWLLEQSLMATLIGPMLPWFWVVGAMLVVVAFVPRRRELPVRSRIALFKFAILFLLPLATVLWAAQFYGVTQGASGSWQWQELGVWGLFALQALVALVLVRRHRGRVEWALLLSMAAMSWGASACLVGLMAVSNDWL
jgi:hypothetical protein